MGHGRGDIALGLVQGILHESRRCLRTLEALGFERGPIRVAGGSVSDPWFRQMLADASGRVVLAPSDGDSDASAVGAAMIAAAGRQVQLPLVFATTSTEPTPGESRPLAPARAAVRAREGPRRPRLTSASRHGHGAVTIPPRGTPGDGRVTDASRLGWSP